MRKLALALLLLVSSTAIGQISVGITAATPQKGADVVYPIGPTIIVEGFMAQGYTDGSWNLGYVGSFGEETAWCSGRRTWRLFHFGLAYGGKRNDKENAEMIIGYTYDNITLLTSAGASDGRLRGTLKILYTF